MNYLFFDTETTGVPKNYNAPASDVNNFPRLVQIGWIVFNENREEVYSREFIVKPDGFEIPASASAVHGITTERAIAEGIELRTVLAKFAAYVSYCDIIIGHNIDFDMKVVGAEFYRTFKESPLEGRGTICTMKSTCEFVGIRNSYGFKYPRLYELHQKLFDTPLVQTHTALDDIQNTAKCFFELERLGVIEVEVNPTH